MEKDLEKRFAVLAEYTDSVGGLINSTFQEFGLDSKTMKAVEVALWGYEKFYFNKHSKEITAIAKILGIERSVMLAVNCYYDLIMAYFKFGSVSEVLGCLKSKLPLMGCTAFVYNSPDGPVLARNLDWDKKPELKKLSVIVEYKGRLRENSFKTVSYPGLTSVFSGMKPGYFAVTLNMVESSDKEIAQPVTMLLRDVLENTKSFDDAVKRFSEEKIMSDCLLTVAGVNKGEMVVIERTPNRAQIRYAENDFIVVTNDYIKLKQDTPNSQSSINPIFESSCGRFEGAFRRLTENLPKTPMDAYDILSDPNVFFGEITDQQMVMCPATDFLDAREPVLPGV